MSVHHTGSWHYEFVSGQGDGYQWCVADEDDAPVCAFTSEAQAQVCVRAYNLTLRQAPTTWRYG